MAFQAKRQPAQDRKFPARPVPKEASGKSAKRRWLILGVALVLVAGGICGVFILPQGLSFFSPPRAERGVAFYQGLGEFDAFLNQIGLEPLDAPLRLNRALEGLEKKSFGVDSSLSLLKRRRLLAHKDPRFLVPYQKALRQAVEAFPFSAPMAALAAEELLDREPALPETTGVKLREYASRIDEEALKPVALSLYILTGTFQDPLQVAAIPQIGSLLSVPLPALPTEGPQEELRFVLAKDAVLIGILYGDIAGATAQIQEMLKTTTAPERLLELVQYAGNFFYDYGNPTQAALLFSRFSDEQSMARQADALWRAGHSSGAQNLWTVLVSPEQAGKEAGGASLEIKIASLYNLAATAKSPEAEAAYLERLLAEAPAPHEFRVYGLIRYTRLLDMPQSIKLLEKEQGRNQPLLDLELLRRRRNGVPQDQAVAETWLLLNRYPRDERLYRWGAYFFDYQRRYTETALLIKNARSYQMTGSWIPFHDSLHLLMEGRIEEAEDRLASMGSEDLIWQVPANRGLMLEARRAPRAALEYYQTATTLLTEPEAAANIYFRIGHCLRILGLNQESRQALERTLELNPNYLNARLELQRLNANF